MYSHYYKHVLQLEFRYTVVEDDPFIVWNHKSLDRDKVLEYIKVLDFYIPHERKYAQPSDNQRRDHDNLCRDYRYFTDNISQFKRLVKLRFGCNFDLPLPQLPPTLKCLQLGFNFNQPITRNILPDALETLKFGNRFNQPLDGILPSGLKALSLSRF